MTLTLLGLHAGRPLSFEPQFPKFLTAPAWPSQGSRRIVARRTAMTQATRSTSPAKTLIRLASCA